MAVTKKPLKIDLNHLLLPQPLDVWAEQDPSAFLVVMRSDRLGGSGCPPTLGHRLMEECLKTLAEAPQPPQGLVLYAGAAKLLAVDNQHAALIQQLKQAGCDLLCCRTSFETLCAGQQPAAGDLTDWIDLTTTLKRARKILWL